MALDVHVYTSCFANVTITAKFVISKGTAIFMLTSSTFKKIMDYFIKNGLNCIRSIKTEKTTIATTPTEYLIQNRIQAATWWHDKQI